MLHNPFLFRGLISGENFKNGPRNWKKYLNDAEIENFRWHDLQHTFASRLVMRGVDLYTASKLPEHSSIEMTQRYVQLAPDYQGNAVKTLVLPLQLAPELTPGKMVSTGTASKLLVLNHGPVAQKDRAAVS